MNALGVLDIDAVSLSGITWRIEEALESRSASRLLPLKEEEAQMNRISSSFRITDVEDMGTRKSLETRPETSLVVYGENLDPPSEADSPPRSSKPVGKPKKKRNKSSISVALDFFQNIIVKRKPSLPPIPIKVNQHPRQAIRAHTRENPLFRLTYSQMCLSRRLEFELWYNLQSPGCRGPRLMGWSLHYHARRSDHTD
jgi:hypothetical protein